MYIPAGLVAGRPGGPVVTLEYYKCWSLSSILTVVGLALFAEMQKMDELLRAPRSVGRYKSTRDDEGR